MNHRGIPTPAQLAVFEFFEAHQREHGYAPSMRHAAKHMGKVHVTIWNHCQALVRKGWMRHLDNSGSYQASRPGLCPCCGRKWDESAVQNGQNIP